VTLSAPGVGGTADGAVAEGLLLGEALGNALGSLPPPGVGASSGGV